MTNLYNGCVDTPACFFTPLVTLLSVFPIFVECLSVPKRQRAKSTTPCSRRRNRSLFDTIDTVTHGNRWHFRHCSGSHTREINFWRQQFEHNLMSIYSNAITHGSTFRCSAIPLILLFIGSIVRYCFSMRQFRLYVSVRIFSLKC